MKNTPYVLSSVFVTAASALLPMRAEALVLHKEDHIAIVGGGLADRQQHHAWLETLIHKAHPTLNLTVRNLGFAADEVNLHPRSDEVPTTEYFLNMAPGQLKATVGKAEVIYTAGADFHAQIEIPISSSHPSPMSRRLLSVRFTCFCISLVYVRGGAGVLR